MLLLAHMGITLAVTKSLEKIMVSRGLRKIPEFIDYRLVLVGSMLPDIIDKPLGGIILRETLGNGRVYSHTLIFLLLLFGLGMFFWFKYGKAWFLVLAGCSLVHDILDGMWLYTATFLWPVYGWGFPKGDAGDWLSLWLENLCTNPYVYVPEIFGGMVILYFMAKLIFQMQVRDFIFTGEFK